MRGKKLVPHSRVVATSRFFSAHPTRQKKGKGRLLQKWDSWHLLVEGNSLAKRRKNPPKDTLRGVLLPPSPRLWAARQARQTVTCRVIKIWGDRAGITSTHRVQSAKNVRRTHTLTTSPHAHCGQRRNRRDAESLSRRSVRAWPEPAGGGLALWGIHAGQAVRMPLACPCHNGLVDTSAQRKWIPGPDKL